MLMMIMLKNMHGLRAYTNAISVDKWQPIEILTTKREETMVTSRLLGTRIQLCLALLQFLS
ncbi:hypothetical protein M513_03188 [Trichuris suis]|nr:hypothetical protein M513_03188 [Trichuris suis]